jgi:hypothetical protein
VCRSARAELHGGQPLPYGVLVAALALLLTLAFLLAGH